MLVAPTITRKDVQTQGKERLDQSGEAGTGEGEEKEDCLEFRRYLCD